MKIAIGADHGGFELKEVIKKVLLEKGYDVTDFGTLDGNSTDYNDHALPVAKGVSEGSFDRGILICGTGIGMSIQANKVRGIRAALVHDLFTAKATREHNDSNILAMGGRVVGPGLALEIVKVWLETDFSHAPRHQRRIDKISSSEK
jgi:ribose 5-phosphate isomerase B